MDTFFPFKLSPKYKIENNKELSALLGITTAKLTYYAYYLSDDNKYHSFKIRKRINGERLIEAPNRGLKDIQKTISHFLEGNYTPRPCVFAYVKGRDIVQHASIHVGQRWLLRLDLKDFFHSISAARISGVLRRAPFCFAKSPANTVARLCTKDGRLPQGSPASPVISNILCRGLDYKLKKLASSNKCYYTRYADDIFISNNGSIFPSAIAVRGDDGNVELSEEIKNIIINSGFEVNAGKTTLRKKSERQLVTGVVVNKKANIPKEFLKSIRSALYAWEKFGLDAAEEYWKQKIERSNRFDGQPPKMKFVIRGKIIHVGHVKGYTDATFLSLVKRLQVLDSEFTIDEQKIRREITDEIHIYSEGITDTKHFQSALSAFKKRGEFIDLKIKFKNPSKPGSASLKTLCENLSETSQKHLTICMFDRDEKNIVNEMSGSPGNYRDHGNNVFSLVIPIPEFRKGNESICIEHLYQDSLLFTCDSEGRRLYFKDEFDNFNCHKTDNNLFCRNAKGSLVYDDNVINIIGRKNVALPKNKFADYVCSGQSPFNNIDYGGFYAVFKQVIEIASTYEK